MEKIKLTFRQFFCFHEYDYEDTKGFEGEGQKGAVCIDCGKVNK